MKVTLMQIAAAMPVFSALASEKLPVKSAFRIAKLGRAVGYEYALYEQQRIALVNRLGEKKKDTEGNETDEIEVTQNNLPEFCKEMTPLNAMEVEIKEQPLRLEDFGTLALTVADMVALEPFVTDKDSGETN